MTDSALITDLYQLTMLAAYHRLGFGGEAVFELYARRLPEERSFLLVAGLEQALEYLEQLRVTPEELDWLAGLGRFDPAFLEWLGTMRFQGDVYAVPEGTVLFADEPWLRIVAPLPVAQFIESRLINLLHFQTLIASKAARCVLAAGPRSLADFGMRRAHGAEAACLAARACAVAGFAGTATVEAGRRYGLPLVGTMAHSFIQAHDHERDAFAGFALTHPRHTTVLIDTYDARVAAHEVVSLVRAGTPIEAVRIDSGDLGAEARAVRVILDAGGCASVRILVSGNLDEYALEALAAGAAPIDGYGVGTRLDTSADAPSIDCVYKLQEYAGRARRKRSAGKATWPGRKQVFRRHDADGRLVGDVVALASETVPGTPLLECVMQHGVRTRAAEPIAVIAARSRASLAALPAETRRLVGGRGVPVSISPAVQQLAADIDRATGG